jgi:uncharacterized phage-associated protein
MEYINKEKLINSILYFTKKVKYPGKTKICKLLFNLDFIHFKETGKSVTGLDYYAWERGPVPKSLFYKLSGDIISEEFQLYIGVIKREKLHEICSKQKPNLSVFSKREKRILEEVAEIYKFAKAEEMTEISHLKEKPWYTTLKTKGETKKIDYMLALDDTAESISKEEATVRQKFIKETHEMLDHDRT